MPFASKCACAFADDIPEDVAMEDDDEDIRAVNSDPFGQNDCFPMRAVVPVDETKQITCACDIDTTEYAHGWHPPNDRHDVDVWLEDDALFAEVEAALGRT